MCYYRDKYTPTLSPLSLVLFRASWGPRNVGPDWSRRLKFHRNDQEFSPAHAMALLSRNHRRAITIIGPAHLWLGSGSQLLCTRRLRLKWLGVAVTRKDIPRMVTPGCTPFLHLILVRKQERRSPQSKDTSGLEGQLPTLVPLALGEAW